MLKTSKPKIKKQIEQNHSIPLSQISPNWNPIFFGTFALTEAPYTKKSSFLKALAAYALDRLQRWHEGEQAALIFFGMQHVP